MADNRDTFRVRPFRPRIGHPVDIIDTTLKCKDPGRTKEETVVVQRSTILNSSECEGRSSQTKS